ncbi:hypothetical protein BGX27_005576, partial [Mortierella sp. AM989]
MMLYHKHHVGIGLEDLEVLALDVHGGSANLTERIEEHSLLQDQRERTEDRRTPERELRHVGEFSFFSPAKKQCRAGNQSSNQAQTDSEIAPTN